MKKLFVLLAFLIPLSISAQIDSQGNYLMPTNIRLPQSDTMGVLKTSATFQIATHIVLYYEDESYPQFKISNMIQLSSGELVVKSGKLASVQLFYSEKEAIDWINSSAYFFYNPDGSLPTRKSVKIKPENLIGIYDITTAKKIELTYKKEKKSIPKQVVVEKQEWEDEYFEKQ